MKNPWSIIIRPVITERSTNLSEREEPQYAFRVNINANKREIRRAIEQCFNVKVKQVNTQRIKGKLKRVRFQEGKRPDWKKAIVTLQKGDHIDLI
jgi:large subunit ribosomal protein L23